jgi:hypothetical protein
MKAILEFTLPEDSIAHQQALKGPRAIYALSTIEHDLRDRLKHRNPDDEHKTPTEAVESIREKFYQILEENDINLDSDFS